MELQTFSSQNSSMVGKERPKRPQTVSIMVSDETKELLTKLASEDSRSVSWIAHELLQRGISAYKRDGLVKEPEGQHIQGRKSA